MATRQQANRSSNEFKCIQWNARGLNKSKLEEFRNFLSKSKPEIVLLSETHWVKPFNVKFKSYHILKKNRPNRIGGGVAILVHKALQFQPLEITTSTTVEAIGVKIFCQNQEEINFVSAYVPRGYCGIEDIVPLLHHPNEFVTAGDFNGHHGTWETDTRPNKAGRSINEALIEEHNACIITPIDLGTRVDPSSGKNSTIDLTFTSPGLAATATIKLGPYLGSDHFPVITTLNAAASKSSDRPPTWILNEKKWPT